MKKFFSGLALLAAVILLASCQDDLFDWGHKLKLSENEIAFRVGKTNTTATRADVQRTVVAPTNVYDLPVTDDGQQFCLMETVTSLDDEVFSTFDGAVTRGTPIYTENFAQTYNGFVGTAFGGFADVADDPNFYEYKFDNTYLWGGTDCLRAAFAPVSGETNVYSHNYDGPEFNLGWPDDEKLLFFLEAPSSAAGVSNMEYWPACDEGEGGAYEPLGSMEFDYVSPTEPTAQKDLLFTSKWIDKENKDTDNKILFYHALTGIRFKVGKPSTHDIHVNINKVTIKDAYGKGHCEIIPLYDDSNVSGANPSNANTAPADASKSAQCVFWTELNTPTNFVLNISSFINRDEDGKQILQDASGAEYAFPESFNAKGKGDKNTYYSSVGTGDQNFNDSKYQYTFFLIPQDFGTDGVTMEIEYTYVFGGDNQNHYIPEETHTNTATVKIANSEWKAGELHTYYLTSEGVYISVEDQMSEDHKTKSSLEIINTGTFAQFQRVLMYGNWVYTDENVSPANHLIVASADLTEIGTFNGFIGKNWALGSDGFYYYKYPINVGNKPNTPLFQSYVGPTTTPFNGTHLEFDISAQAVRYSSPDDGQLHVATYNKNFVNAEWNLTTGNVTIVELGEDTPGTVGGSILDWLETNYEVFSGESKKSN